MIIIYTSNHDDTFQHTLPDEFCTGYPHNLLPTPGYWIECSGHPLPDDTIWDESEPDSVDYEDGSNSGSTDQVDQNVQVSHFHAFYQ